MAKMKLCNRYYATSNRFALCFLVSILATVSFASAQCSQEFDPADLLDRQPDQVTIIKPNVKVQRLSLDQKQIQTISNIVSNISEEKTPGSSNLLIAQGPTTPQTQELWKARITAPDNSSSLQSKTQLQEVIQQVNAVEFKPKKQPEPAIVAEKPANSEPNQTQTTVTVSVTSTQTLVQDNNSADLHLASQTLQIFKDMSQTPEKIENPFELAETLFNAGCLKEAAVCYQQALLRLANDPKNDSDKAWILFQIGNCLKNSDLSKALEYYKKLMDQFPASQWAELATAQCTLINWFLENNVDAMLKQSKI